jgi:hypothetical protein
MRLLDDEGNRPLNKVWVYLTEGEARELAAQLALHFGDEDRPREWHGHVESDDGRAKELTVALYDPDAEAPDPRWRDWFEKDQWTPGMFGDPAD